MNDLDSRNRVGAFACFVCWGCLVMMAGLSKNGLCKERRVEVDARSQECPFDGP